MHKINNDKRQKHIYNVTLLAKHNPIQVIISNDCQSHNFHPAFQPKCLEMEQLKTAYRDLNTNKIDIGGQTKKGTDITTEGGKIPMKLRD